jgi:hypothetical protein
MLVRLEKVERHNDSCLLALVMDKKEDWFAIGHMLLLLWGLGLSCDQGRSQEFFVSWAIK